MYFTELIKVFSLYRFDRRLLDFCSITLANSHFVYQNFGSSGIGLVQKALACSISAFLPFSTNCARKSKIKQSSRYRRSDVFLEPVGTFRFRGLNIEHNLRNVFRRFDFDKLRPGPVSNHLRCYFNGLLRAYFSNPHGYTHWLFGSPTFHGGVSPLRT